MTLVSTKDSPAPEQPPLSPPSPPQGYRCPDFTESFVISPRMDVYSFGVLVAEALTGQVALGKPPSLAVCVKKHVREGLPAAELAEGAAGWPPEAADALVALALQCCRLEHEELSGAGARPPMVAVLAELVRVRAAMGGLPPRGPLGGPSPAPVDTPVPGPAPDVGPSSIAAAFSAEMAAPIAAWRAAENKAAGEEDFDAAERCKAKVKALRAAVARVSLLEGEHAALLARKAAAVAGRAYVEAAALKKEAEVAARALDSVAANASRLLVTGEIDHMGRFTVNAGVSETLRRIADNEKNWGQKAGDEDSARFFHDAYGDLFAVALGEALKTNKRVKQMDLTGEFWHSNPFQLGGWWGEGPEPLCCSPPSLETVVLFSPLPRNRCVVLPPVGTNQRRRRPRGASS